MSVVILDGGMGQELLRHSKSEATEMWSARVLMDEPDLVIDTHRAFIDAGAEVITINAYAASPERLANYGYAEMFKPLQERAIDCAVRAKLASGRDVKITGSMPPLFSSYNPDLTTDLDFAINTYREMVEAQKDGVDVLLAETLGSMTEVRAALTAMDDVDMPKWLSVTISDEHPTHLRSGESLVEAVNLADEMGITAFLLNCSRPETISKAIPIIAHPKRPYGAYANGFTSVQKLQMGDAAHDILRARKDLDPEAYAAIVDEWVKEGATLVGGCCEVSPEHIQELRKRFGGKS